MALKLKSADAQASPTALLAAMKGEIQDRVEALRREIADHQARLETVQDGNLPRSEYLQRVESWIDAKAAEFAAGAEYSISGLRLPKPETVEFGKLAVRGSQTSASVAETDLGGLLAWLLPDLLRQKLAGLIEGSGYVAGPPLADRPRLLREVQGQLDDLELSEERLICEASAANFQINRRPDCRPAIILNLALADE